VAVVGGSPGRRRCRFPSALLFVAGGILLERADRRPVVHRGVDHADGSDLVLLERPDICLVSGSKARASTTLFLASMASSTSTSVLTLSNSSALATLQIFDLVEKTEDVEVAE